MMEKVNIPKSFLLSGQDFKVTNSVIVKHPTVQEVLDIDTESEGFYSENIYYTWVNLFICDPYNYMVYLDDKKIDYETIEPFDLFIMLYEDMANRYFDLYKDDTDEEKDKKFLLNPYFKAFEFFIGRNHFMIAKNTNGEKVIGDEATQTVLIDKKVFSYISEFIKVINGIPEIDKINPEDDFAKQILIEDERAKLKKLAKSKKEEINTDRLGNLLSSITWASNGAITPFNRNNLHMYDLVEGVNRTDKLLNFNHVMTGIYSGCVDKDKINMQKVSWQV